MKSELGLYEVYEERSDRCFQKTNEDKDDFGECLGVATAELLSTS